MNANKKQEAIYKDYIAKMFPEVAGSFQPVFFIIYSL